VEFLEFAVDDAAAHKVGGVMRGLGFARVAHHRSKAVERWSQGGINLVLNREKEGFAHSFLVTHGPSVCAIALKVDDAAACTDRATALLDQPFRQAVGPGELDIPAVRGVAGSLLYFVDGRSGLDRLWDVDFEPAQEIEQPASAGLVAVEHVSQAPIPDNYYDDLEVRADLSVDTIGLLRAGNILYDRDGAAEFFHAYTRPALEGGFFFEIVERRGGYRGFGAINAPVRLAAQSRLLPPPGMPKVA
jgi:4-hydroxyphenylpyruvate dioxygenase-like putative hemolysin